MTCAPPRPSPRPALSSAHRPPLIAAAGLGLGRGGLVEEAQGHEAAQHADAGRQEAERQPQQKLYGGASKPAPRPWPISPPPAPRAADRLTRARHRAQLLDIMEYDKYPKHVPNYLSITTLPPRRPPRHFCVVCGEAGPYTHPLDGARLCFKSSEGRKCYEIYTETKGARQQNATSPRSRHTAAHHLTLDSHLVYQRGSATAADGGSPRQRAKGRVRVRRAVSKFGMPRHLFRLSPKVQSHRVSESSLHLRRQARQVN